MSVPITSAEGYSSAMSLDQGQRPIGECGWVQSLHGPDAGSCSYVEDVLRLIPDGCEEEFVS